MDPRLKELLANIDKSGASLKLYAIAGGNAIIGLISDPRRFTGDVAEFIEEEIAREGEERPAPEAFRSLVLDTPDVEEDPRYITLRDATVVLSAIESHKVSFLRLDAESISSWWLRPGRHPDDDDDADADADPDAG